jgi:hypothetical protein
MAQRLVELIASVRSDDGEISRLDGSVSRRRRITVVTIAAFKRSNTVVVQSDQGF